MFSNPPGFAHLSDILCGAVSRPPAAFRFRLSFAACSRALPDVAEPGSRNAARRKAGPADWDKISGENGMKKSILLAVDGSSGGGKALRHVLATIDPDTVGIVLAYVIEWSPYSFNTPEENAERHKRRESEISRAKAGVVAPPRPSSRRRASTSAPLSGTAHRPRR